MGLIDRTIKGGVWQSITMAAQAFLQVFVIAILARLISPEEFGVFAIVSIITALVIFVSEAGFGPSLIFQRDLTTGHLNAAFVSTIVLSVFFAVGLWAAAPGLGEFFENQQVTEIIRWLSIAIPFNVFGTVSKSLLERELKFKSIMWANTISFVFGYAVVAVVLAYLGYGIWALVIATMCQYVLLSAVYYFMSPHAISLNFRKVHFRELFRFGSGQTLGRFFHFVSTRADVFIVSKFLDTGQVGIYERMLRIVELPGRYIGGVFNKVLFPAMAQIQHEPDKLKAVYLSGVALVNACLLPITALFVITANELVAVLLGSRWSEGVTPLQILLLTVAVQTTVSLSDSLMRAVGAVFQGAWRKAVVAIIVIIGSLVGVRYGLVGVAVAVNLSLLVRYLLMGKLAMTITKASVREFMGAHAPGVVLALLVTGTTLVIVGLMRRMELPDYAVLFGGVCGSTVVAIGVILVMPGILGRHGNWMLAQILRRMARQNLQFVEFFLRRIESSQ